MIHIVNGDALANKMKNFEGIVMPWREMYDFGPLMKNNTQESSHFLDLLNQLLNN